MYIPDNLKQELFSKRNVVGFGFGYKVTAGVQSDKEALVVLVRRKESNYNLKSQDLIPKFASGLLQTDVVEIGDVRALSYINKYRPAPGGVSIGHYKITAGTLGSMVKDANTGESLILSNNHVLANSNESTLGDPILQPGPADGGKLARDEIGTLLDFIPIDFGQDDGSCPFAEGYSKIGNFLAGLVGSKHKVKSYIYNPQAVNLVDAAVALPYNYSDLDSAILDIGFVSGTEEAYLGMEVHKTGRTTEHTDGKITLIGATIQVGYGGSKVATFENQLVSGYMSRGGDSGSLLVSKESNKAVGLLFAGSDQATIYNPIQYVIDALGIVI